MRVLYLIAFFLLIGCEKKTTESDIATDLEAERIVDSVVAAASKPTTEETVWKYNEDVDKMGETTKFAKIQSKDVLRFSPPYSGGSISTLIIRKGKSGTDIMYTISDGQIVSANIIDGGTIRVRFDEEKPMTIGVTSTSDGSSDVIFLDSTQKLINKMKASKKMVLEVEFYQEGNHQIEFNVSGLKW